MALREQLQQTLGSAYTLERELGGGGMSRVFVARDENLRRNVVVKVLPHDLVAGVNVERFNREIELAAGLQHPHIVPVLSAGQTSDGMPYYTMPFVEGESLRARLARAGGLPLTEAIGYLRDVAKALAYAHERNVVHRDIKPDNVLLSGGSATVTDFGIAKALAAAKGGQRPEGDSPKDLYPTGLTAIGVSIGTPAYMSPEQAAGDPATDHRADIYSFGCLAFELLSGRPPFVAKTPRKLLAQHMAEAAPSVAEVRPDTPPALAEMVSRCLEKDPESRPQSASDVVRVLETVTSGGNAAMPAILFGGRGTLKKALAIYAAAFLVVAIVAKAAIVVIGLPDWVFPGALVVMALGLPAIFFTAYVHHATRRAITQTPTYTPGGTPSMQHGTMATLALKASPHMSWRRTALGGAWAVGGFVILVGGYMLLRATGIGPFGSLMAAGAIAKDEKLLVADFPSPQTDTTLGPVVTEAFRTALGQSQSVNVLQQTAIQNVLRRMQKPLDTRIDFAVARQIATREGIRAVIDGNLIGIGGKYVVSAKLMSPQSGEELATFTQNAASQGELLDAIDRLAKQVRAKIGESLRRVQATPPLEQVTTPSIEALKKYVLGTRLATGEGETAKGIALLEEAIALDTGFAMAYRKLAIVYGNRGLFDKGNTLMEKAFVHRERLSDAERYLVTASYYDKGPHQDIAKAITAYEQLLEIQPNNTAALNNFGNIQRVLRQYAKAEELYAKAIRVGPAAAVHYGNLMRVRVEQNKFTAAQQAVDSFAAAYPNNLTVLQVRAELFSARHQEDSIVALVNANRARLVKDPLLFGDAVLVLADVARMRGKISESRRLAAEGYSAVGEAGLREAAVIQAADEAFNAAWFYGDRTAALRALEDTLARHPLDSIEHLTEPFNRLEWTYAAAGRVDKARAVLARWEQAKKKYTFGEDSLFRHAMRGDLAFASGKYDEALQEYRAGDVIGCRVCNLPFIGQAYDLAGQVDSALAVFERYVTTPAPARTFTDGVFLAGIHKRLGELYETKGNRDKALSNYNRFVELWKDADAPLQPKVAEVKAKIARLSKSEPR